MGFLDNIKTIFGPPQREEPVKVVSKKVLVVEDDKALGDSLQSRLQQDGHTVIRAANGQEGLEIAGKEKPDLIILDLIMPVMSGNSMLHALRKVPDFADLPVIVLTNAGTVDNIHETKSYDHASDFLIKSNVSLEEISNRVKQYINR